MPVKDKQSNLFCLSISSQKIQSSLNFFVVEAVEKHA
jgi:hypothetical protein